jgi:hypothetical protein
VPAEQRLLRGATVDCNALNARLRAQRTEQRQRAHRTVYRTCPVHHRTPGGPTNQSSNGLLTWLAHRTVSGGAPDYPVRHATAHFQRPFLVVGAINTQPPHIQWHPSFYTSTPYKSYNIQYKTHQRDQILSQLHTKRFVNFVLHATFNKPLLSSKLCIAIR